MRLKSLVGICTVFESVSVCLALILISAKSECTLPHRKERYFLYKLAVCPQTAQKPSYRLCTVEGAKR